MDIRSRRLTLTANMFSNNISPGKKVSKMFTHRNLLESDNILDPISSQKSESLIESFDSRLEDMYLNKLTDYSQFDKKMGLVQYQMPTQVI